MQNMRSCRTRPLSFEELKTGAGFVLYSTRVDFKTTDPVLLSIPELKDRAYVYVNKVRLLCSKLYSQTDL